MVLQKENLLRLLRSQGFGEDILKAFENVRREDFVPEKYRDESYENRPLPIGRGQTISQPTTIAFMLEKLDPKPSQKILEVGSGSGYVLALLSAMLPDAKIYGVERVAGLAEQSRQNLQGIPGAEVVYRPQGVGLPGEAPFDRILASASADKLPEELLGQLAADGVLVCPVGNSIIAAKKKAGEISYEDYPGFVFVPLKN